MASLKERNECIKFVDIIQLLKQTNFFSPQWFSIGKAKKKK